MNLIWLGELFRESFRNLVRHKVRSILTLLGVVFGVASVITMLAIGEGAQRTVLKEIEGLGLRNVIVVSEKPPDVSADQQASSRRRGLLSYGITRKDVEQFRVAVPQALITEIHQVNQKVYFRSKRLNVETLGVTPDYFDYYHSRLLQGRPLSDVDETRANRVAVLTEKAAASVRVPGGVLGATLQIGTRHFEVVGVVRMPSRSVAGTVFIPYESAKKTFGTVTAKAEAGRFEFTRTEVGQVVLHTESEEEVPRIAAVVKRTLEMNHDEMDYSTVVPLDILRSKQRTQRVFNFVLITIAAISLLVGGIGIMNIMLAVVMERFREIGIRRAVGAGQRDIFLQFLTETVTLSGLGGLLGCVLGIGSVPIASAWTGWPGVITPYAIVLALLVSFIVGLVFGTAPAIRAARLNPVDALRYE